MQVLAHLITILISGGLFAFIEFMIKRHDDKNGLMKDVLRAVAETNEKVDKLERSIQEDKAVNSRTRILRFSDELYSNIDHSKEYFEQILDDIQHYDRYCEQHPNFKNGRTKTACEYINSEYIRLFKEHKL